MRKILIADDEKTIREGIAKLIQVSNLPITIAGQASNGVEALQLIQSIAPDIILIDITMPGLTGLDVIAATKKIVPNAKFIIISGHDSFAYAQKAIELGAFHYLLKPVKRNQLLTVIENALTTLEPPGHTTQQSASESFTTDTMSISSKALAYIHDHYCNSDLTLSTVADELHISQSYLTRIIKKKTNLSFTEYLNELRIKQAIHLLSTNNELLVAQIAEQLGYSSQHYFSRVFKNHTGVSPMEYKSSNS